MVHRPAGKHASKPGTKPTCTGSHDMTITIRLLAHASIQVTTGTQTIYIDPSTKNTGLKKEAFTPADLILVTHEHQDHMDKDLLKKIRKGGSPILAPGGVKKALGKAGVVWEMNASSLMQMGDGTKIRTVDAYNVKRFRSPGTPFHPKGLGVGFVLDIGGKTIYHAGDTDFIPEMAGQIGPGIDVALLPADGTYTMDIEEAIEAALAIKPKVAIPMHLRGTDPAGFKKAVEAKSSVKVVLLENGQEHVLA